jgi:hypothetical protein
MINSGKTYTAVFSTSLDFTAVLERRHKPLGQCIGVVALAHLDKRLRSCSRILVVREHQASCHLRGWPVGVPAAEALSVLREIIRCVFSPRC